MKKKQLYSLMGASALFIAMTAIPTTPLRALGKHVVHINTVNNPELYSAYIQWVGPTGATDWCPGSGESVRGSDYDWWLNYCSTPGGICSYGNCQVVISYNGKDGNAGTTYTGPSYECANGTSQTCIENQGCYESGSPPSCSASASQEQIVTRPKDTIKLKSPIRRDVEVSPIHKKPEAAPPVKDRAKPATPLVKAPKK